MKVFVNNDPFEIMHMHNPHFLFLNILYMCILIIFMKLYYTVGKKIIWSPADFVRLSTDKEMISQKILMVGLFEKWETE